MSLTPYPTLRLKLTMPQALKLQFLPAVPGSNAAAAAAAAQASADAAQSAANTATAATANKVDKSGDTMSGFLTLNADPTANLQAATKQYVDGLVGGGPFQPLDADLTSLAGASATNQWYYRSAANTWSPVTVGANLTFTGGTLAATGGGGGAPVGAEYITSTADATLTAERVLTDTATITWDRTTPGQIKASTAAGGGNVSNSGTPTAGQYAKWVTATTIQGVATATVLTDIGAQPLDGDLTAIAALAGTNTIYYRSAANTWSAVNVSTGLAFAGGNLTSTVISGAPVGAEYITSTADVTLTAERVLTDTATVTWDRTTAGQIKANAVASGGGTTAPQGRLTLQTATPVMTTTQATKAMIFYTPYVGDQIGLYNGTSFTMTTFAELSAATTDTTKSPAAIGASKCNDWYVWSDAGTIRLGHGPDWIDDITRSAGTALVRVKGVWLNNASITNGPAAQRGTYVGTTRSNASSQLDWIYGAVAANGTAGFFGIWNQYNRCTFASFTGDSTASWTYGTNTIQAANNSSTMRASFVRGQDEESVSGAYDAITTPDGSVGGGNAGVGLDATTVLSGSSSNTSAGAPRGKAGGQYRGFPGIGFHFISANEVSPAGTQTYFGTVNQGQSGLFVEFRA